MSNQIKNLGRAKNVEVIKRFVNLSGKTVVDIGCGSMKFTRILTELGASVLAIDPDPIQAEKNRDTTGIDDIKFVESSADSIPAEDNSVDGCFFSYSLHHVPASIYPQAFAEVKRVLKQDGFLYVIEPTHCPLNEVLQLFHDEEVERAAAQNAILTIAAPYFLDIQQVQYHDIRKFDGFEGFASHYSSLSFNSHYSEADVRRGEVRELFERHGKPDYEFSSPKRVAFLKGIKE